MTDAELDEAGTALLPTSALLPPVPLADMLDYFARHTHELLLDIWTLRDSVDARLTGTRHAAAVAAVAELAALYDEATERVRTLAAALCIPLPLTEVTHPRPTV